MGTDGTAKEAPKKRYEHLEDELEDLKHELEAFQQEKERVRQIIGRIGGVPKLRRKLINVLFIIALVVLVVLSIVLGEAWRMVMIELTTIILSLKIIYLIHCQVKVNHFQFWVLSSIEWRLNQVKRQLDYLQREMADD